VELMQRQIQENERLGANVQVTQFHLDPQKVRQLQTAGYLSPPGQNSPDVPASGPSGLPPGSAPTNSPPPSHPAGG
jgi:hypothetical protein